MLTYATSGSTLSRIVSGFKKHKYQCYFTRFDDLRYTGNKTKTNWIEQLMESNPQHVDNINLRYSLKCLESLGYQFLDKLEKTSTEHKISFFRFLQQKIIENDVERIDFVTQTIFKLVQAFDKDPFLDPATVFQIYFDKVDVKPFDMESHYQFIKRIIVTPSRTIFVPPEPIAINRILRQHIRYVDNFARVCFRDEDFSQFNVHSEQATYNVRKVIDQGIRISDEIVFQFLACSNSQLRSQGLWLFYPQCPITVESIRDSIGDLNKMKTTQKYVTRMGLAFTATDFALTEEVDIQEIPEKELIVGNKRFIFSDGVGCISPKVRDLIVKEKYGYQADYRPVAFQVRVGGCKGMVAVNPLLDGLTLQIRPSMKKFESNHKNIEPCGYSGPRELFMNRQVIAILRAQGVPDNNFISLQNRSLIEIADMLTSEHLASHEMGSMLRVRVSNLQRSSIRITTEPFLRRQLVSLYKFKVRDALAKTRFKIDINRGRQMRGLMDETNTLNYGEVFVQYSELGDNARKIILEGELFVTKNPCLHPGDLKRVVAVDVPGLRHLYDVVVFPAKGQRPIPNELSGSDLDGDEYFVCWEELLMPQKDCEAADYYIETIDPVSEVSYEPPPEFTEADINDFVFNYITKGSKLGQISNAHAIWADRRDKGVMDKQCITLAGKHSDAVDFIKTGIAPSFDFSERSLIYPDWMMKPDKAAYSSKTAIGKMFHIVQGLEHSVLDLNIPEDDIAPDELFLLDEVPTTEELESARKLYTEYCTELANIMVAYGIADEGDIAAGCLNTIKRSLAKEHERNYDMREQCLSMYRSLQRKYRRAFFSNLGVSQENWRQEEERVLRQAAAWYFVTYNNPQPHQDLVLLSFPWCVANILIRIPELMNTTKPNSIRAELRAELKKWYSGKARKGDKVKEKCKRVLKMLNESGVVNITDVSRSTYGLILGDAFVYYIDETPKQFAKGLKLWLETQDLNKDVSYELNTLATDFQKSSEDWAVSEVTVDNKIIKVFVTNDEILHKKVMILKQYCQNYDILGHTMFLILNWAEKNNITTNASQEADLALSFLEFMLRKEDSQIMELEEEPCAIPDVVIGQYPHKNTATLYLEYLRWIIGDCKMSGSRDCLDTEFLKIARALLGTEKCMVALMREYHFVSYALKFESTENYKQNNIIRKKDKKMCFNIARATSFCSSFFNNNPDINDTLETGKKIEIKIRETELGSINALVLEIWGENPQRMNEIADAFEIDESKFQLYGNYLFVCDPRYNQLNFLAPRTLDKPLPKYFSLRRHESKPREKAPLRHDINPLYYDNNIKDASLKELVHGEILRKTRLMRDGLYNQISHGKLTATTTFGKLKIKRCENGSLDKEHMSLSKESKDGILRKLRGIAKCYPKERTSYVFHVLYEGINYKITFDKFHKLKSLSLVDIVWTDMMILNDRGVDLNLMINSTHTLTGERLNHLPLTYELYRGSKNWIDRVDNEKGIQLIDRNQIPCFIISIDVITERTHRFSKDPALADMTVSELTVEVYQGLEKGFVKHSRTYHELKLSAEIETLLNTEFLRTYENVALDLSTVEKSNRTVRRSGSWRAVESNPRLPRRPGGVKDTTKENTVVSSSSYLKQTSLSISSQDNFAASQRSNVSTYLSSDLPPSTNNSLGQLVKDCRRRTMANSGDLDDFQDLTSHEPESNEIPAMNHISAFQDGQTSAIYPIPSENSCFTKYENLQHSGDFIYNHPLSYPGVTGSNEPSVHQPSGSSELLPPNNKVTVDCTSFQDDPAANLTLEVEDVTEPPSEIAEYLTTHEVSGLDSLSPYSNVSSGPDVEVVIENFTECSPRNAFEEDEHDEPNVDDYEDRGFLDVVTPTKFSSSDYQVSSFICHHIKQFFLSFQTKQNFI